jgi:hypothetical protein
MQILQYDGKETQLNTIQRYYIYAEFSENNHLNDKHTIYPDKTFYALLKPHEQYIPKPSPQHPPKQTRLFFELTPLAFHPNSDRTSKQMNCN